MSEAPVTDLGRRHSETSKVLLALHHLTYSIPAASIEVDTDLGVSVTAENIMNFWAWFHAVQGGQVIDTVDLAVHAKVTHGEIAGVPTRVVVHLGSAS